MNTSRRAFLASAAAAGPLLAGCLGGENGVSNADGTQRGTTDTGSDDSTTRSTTAESGSTASDGSGTGAGTGTDASATGTSASSTSTTAAAATLDHPAAVDLASQPFLGPPPGTVPSIIAFEDPSCHNCERFNTNTFPELESKLINTGKVSYVYRHFPYAFEWGRPAMAALEATLSRDESAFWSLKEHYFATQSEFSDGNVLSMTEAFLANETALDAAAVIGDVEAGKFEKSVERDISAGEAAGVVSTPTFFLFRGSDFVTEIRGAQSYEVFAQALGI